MHRAVEDPCSPGDVIVPAGAQLDEPPPKPAERKRNNGSNHYIDVVKAAAATKLPYELWIRRRPLGISKGQPLSSLGMEIQNCNHFKTFAAKKGLDIEDAFEELMLFLWDTLWYAMCVKWTELGVCNIDANRTNLLADNFMKGQRRGEKPIHDGICAFCGQLLHGKLGGTDGNKFSGPPMNHNQDILLGDPATQQPPFLCRYSPAKLAQEVPEIFVHDAETNVLSLKDPERMPWLRPTDGRHKPRGPRTEADRNKGNTHSTRDTWLYCKSCHTSRLQGKGRIVTFRDRCSYRRCIVTMYYTSIIAFTKSLRNL